MSLGRLVATLVYQLVGASFSNRSQSSGSPLSRSQNYGHERRGHIPHLRQRSNFEWNFGFSVIPRIRACGGMVRSQIRLPQFKLSTTRRPVTRSGRVTGVGPVCHVRPIGDEPFARSADTSADGWDGMPGISPKAGGQVFCGDYGCTSNQSVDLASCYRNLSDFRFCSWLDWLGAAWILARSLASFSILGEMVCITNLKGMTNVDFTSISRRIGPGCLQPGHVHRCHQCCTYRRAARDHRSGPDCYPIRAMERGRLGLGSSGCRRTYRRSNHRRSIGCPLRPGLLRSWLLSAACGVRSSSW